MSNNERQRLDLLPAAGNRVVISLSPASSIPPSPRKMDGRVELRPDPARACGGVEKASKALAECSAEDLEALSLALAHEKPVPASSTAFADLEARAETKEGTGEDSYRSWFARENSWLQGKRGPASDPLVA
ncbi:hypothetical protein EMIHUDRAFT_435277 [Emiliania huxleyi CCMP1516]|uniref:Uncharacterized protein n=2 Tax=Emiliania huxleyi TaxID=2903 RepID=A0A0D3JNQ1_EMIH1|nr:hypothetical protein EMIHUDRAFT_435277 [Emiliania huxleyi CCMP1516]EOD25136.1 hypothetical protein EMIHUDRAFT_435277 [Emiliania huxleyi CCMP1516]|eukprot:XP_005777565.1 hypothetical protein EMIHUDRAFT_435277 [Emiliania huxleyi CCMP1516]